MGCGYYGGVYEFRGPGQDLDKAEAIYEETCNSGDDAGCRDLKRLRDKKNSGIDPRTGKLTEEEKQRIIKQLELGKQQQERERQERLQDFRESLTVGMLICRSVEAEYFRVVTKYIQDRIETTVTVQAYVENILDEDRLQLRVAGVNSFNQLSYTELGQLVPNQIIYDDRAEWEPCR